jgi:hypothetical protein
MTPIATNHDHIQPALADNGRPRFFIDDRYDADSDGDWWLDLGSVDLPVATAV